MVNQRWTIGSLDKTVEAELLELPPDMQARFLRITELLETFEPQHVGMPHVRGLGNKLWEMRLTGRSGIGRAIYALAPGRRLVVLHAFVKKSMKTPRSALRLAEARLAKLKR